MSPWKHAVCNAPRGDSNQKSAHGRIWPMRGSPESFPVTFMPCDTEKEEAAPKTRVCRGARRPNRRGARSASGHQSHICFYDHNASFLGPVGRVWYLGEFAMRRGGYFCQLVFCSFFSRLWNLNFAAFGAERRSATLSEDGRGRERDRQRELKRDRESE